MPKYIARPVEVEAVVFDGTSGSMGVFARRSHAFGNIVPDRRRGRKSGISVYCDHTGTHIMANQGDVIVAHGESSFDVFDRETFERLFAPKGA